jgi:hypothetical protein
MHHKRDRQPRAPVPPEQTAQFPDGQESKWLWGLFLTTADAPDAWAAEGADAARPPPSEGESEEPTLLPAA